MWYALPGEPHAQIWDCVVIRKQQTVPRAAAVSAGRRPDLWRFHG